MLQTWDRIGAFEECSWYFGSSTAAIGVRGMPFEAGGGGVFDDFASHRAHMSKRHPEHRGAVARRGKIGDTLTELASDVQRDLQRAFTPYGAERAPFALQEAFRKNGLCLLDVAVHHELTAREWQKAHECIVPEVLPEWVKPWLASELRKLGKGSALPRGTRLDKLVVAAEGRIRECLEAYDVVRVRRIASEKRAEEAYYEGVRAKLWKAC